MHATALDDDGADGTTGYQTGEEHDLRSFKKVLLGAVTAMVVVAVLAVGSASAVTPAPPPPPSGTIPTRDTRLRTRTCRTSHGEASTFVSCGCDEVSFPEGATATWMLEDPPNDPDFQPALDFGSEVVRTTAHRRLGLAERPASHSSSSSCTTAPARRLRKAVRRGLDAAHEAERRRRRRRQRCRFLQEAGLRHAHAESIRLLGPYSNCWHADPQIDPRHRIQVIVKGNLPLETDFSEWGLGDHLTLPDDWGRWAAVTARSTADNNVVEAMTNWDIHDDSLTTEGHTITNPLGKPVPGRPERRGDLHELRRGRQLHHGGPLGGSRRCSASCPTTDTTSVRGIRSTRLHDALRRQGRRG